MLKQLVNECIITLQIQPVGPILVKSGAPTLSGPDMAFVRVWRNETQEVYLPGSSLKGVFRSHAERIARTIGPEGQTIACDPFAKEGPERFCGECFEKRRHDSKAGIPDAYRLPHPVERADELNRAVYGESCAICRLFGSTWFAGRLATADAYAVGNPPGTQTRDGVGIDRFTGGSASGAKFDLEVVTGGLFETKLHIRNFELWQLGLLAFIMEDLKDGLLRIGAGKSRGLGEVTGSVTRVDVRYTRAHSQPRSAFAIIGIDRFLADAMVSGYQLARQEPVVVDGVPPPVKQFRVSQIFSGELFPWKALAESWTQFASGYTSSAAMTFVRMGSDRRA